MLAAALVLSGVTVAAAQTPDGLVRAAAEAPRHLSYVGQYQSTIWGAKNAVATLVKIEHAAPDETRRTYLAPQALYGQYVVTRGPATVEFDVQRHRAIVSHNDAPENTVAFNDNIALLARNYRAIAGPDESVAGRRVTTVSLVNRYTNERLMRLWIDAQTHFLLARETYRADGSPASRMRFDEIRYTSGMPASFFSLDPPAGYAKIDGRSYGVPSSNIAAAVKAAGFTPARPTYLPEGFAVISADVGDVKGITSLHLLYSDGVRNLSLFQNARDAEADFGALVPKTTSFEGHTAHYVRNGPTTLLSWREHGLAFALVGDLDITEMIEIAKSVIPN